MLLDLRDGIRNSKWLKYLLVTVICIPFALFGVNSYFSGGGPDYAAKVNGEKVSLRSYDSAYQQRRQQITQMFGGNIPEGFNPASMIDSSAIMDTVVSREIIRQTTVDNQFAIGDDALASSLVGIEGFAVDGRFDKERYQLQLQSMGLAPADFEQQYRGDLIMQQFSDSVVTTGFAIGTENSRLQQLRDQKRNLATITFNLQEKADSIEISDEDASTYYDANTTRFNNPEKVIVEYVELKIDDLKASVDVTDEDLKGYYEANKTRWVVPDKRDASHILLAVDSDAGDSEANKKLELANSLIERIGAGEALADLAKEFSDDPGSGEKGGSLGEFGRGVMVPPFEEAVFAMQEGEVSAPVRSDFGYHIILLNKIIPERGQSFDEVKDEVDNQFRIEAAETKFFSASDLLSNAAYENSDSLQPAADETGLEIKTSDWLDQNTTDGLGQYRQVITAALTDEVLNQGLNSEVLVVGENHSIVLRTLEHEEAKPKPLEEVQADVVKILQKERAQESLTALAESVQKELEAGGDAAAIATANNAQYAEPQAIGRSEPDADRQITQALFAMPKPAAGASAYRTVTTGEGDLAVAIFSGLAAPDETAEAGDVAATGSQASASSEFVALVSALRDTATVVTNDAVLGVTEQEESAY